MGIEKCPDLKQDILNGGKPICPVCGESRSIRDGSDGYVEELSDEIYRDGTFPNISYGRVKYRCASCGWRWYGSKFSCFQY